MDIFHDYLSIELEIKTYLIVDESVFLAHSEDRFFSISCRMFADFELNNNKIL